MHAHIEFKDHKYRENRIPKFTCMQQHLSSHSSHYYYDKSGQGVTVCFNFNPYLSD